MPWQQHVANAAFEVDPRTGRLAYREVRLTVPRQSGKTTLVLAKNLTRMALAGQFGGRQRLTYTAQTRNDARKKFVDDYLEELRACKPLRGRWTSRLSNGSESIRWTANGSLWGIDATGEKSGHGSILDVGDVDEAFAQVDDRIEQAMKPAMVTRPCPQLWVISTAGTDESTYLRGKVDTGREFAEAGRDTGVAYFEWAADPRADPDDEATWWACMPALGHTIDVEAVRAERAGMTLANFSRAYLNLWVPRAFGESVIPPEQWAACRDEHSQVDTGRPLVLAVDVSPMASWASIVVAGWRPDGVPHVEVIAHEPGDGWVVERLAQLQQKWGRRTVVLDGAGPAAALQRDIERARLRVRVTNTREMTKACSTLQRLVRDGGVRHIGQDVLDDTHAAAAKRQLLDAWAWGRRQSSADISPLVAVTLAVWSLTDSAREASVAM